MLIQKAQKTPLTCSKPLIVLKKHNEYLFSNLLFIH
ncbi:MAG: hypothetical protein JWP94_244 [Mucilaginibacter sp.]|jgi:hypothetical protein|nr:hypothetical protein [Mucilaginibacter sp.]